MTKAATSRLGTPLLNALNYGKNAMLATGLGMSVAMAQPIQVDNRPPLRPKTQAVQVSQPMSIKIGVHAAPGMDERAIAREVTKQLAQIQQQSLGSLLILKGVKPFLLSVNGKSARILRNFTRRACLCKKFNHKLLFKLILHQRLNNH